MRGGARLISSESTMFAITGPGRELEAAGLLVEDGEAGDVGGEQVGGALDAAEGGADGEREGAGEHGLGHARHVFH